MARDMQGIHKYTEADNEATFSDLLNLGMDSVSERFAAEPATTENSPLTIASGWALVAQSVIRCGRLRQLRFQFSRTGAAVAVPANGNLDNLTVATLRDTKDYPFFRTATYSGGSGRLASGSMNETTGILDLAAVAPGNAIATGEQLELCCVYLAREVA